MRGAELLAWLASVPRERRERAVDDLLGIDGPPPSASQPPGEHLLGYHASGVDPIVQAFTEAAVTKDDVVVDLGSGLGRVVMLAHLLTGAMARGVELQPALVDRARDAAQRLGIDVSFSCADARHADLGDGTVFFFYAPFTGPVLADVLRRLHAVAERRAIVVCALAIDLHRDAPWLVARPLDAFWLTIYDSVVQGVPPRA